jgi:hypothetical protein
VEKRHKTSDGNVFGREPKKRKLEEPMQNGGIVDFFISGIGMLDLLAFDINIIYKSQEGDSVKDYLNIDDIISFDPDVNNEFSKLDIGFGTQVGHCIKPLNYKFILK